MKRALTFYLLLAGWSFCHAKDQTYKLGSIKETASREQKWHWKALRQIVEESHFKVIPFDTIDFRFGREMK